MKNAVFFSTALLWLATTGCATSTSRLADPGMPATEMTSTLGWGRKAGSFRARASIPAQGETGKGDRLAAWPVADTSRRLRGFPVCCRARPPTLVARATQW